MDQYLEQAEKFLKDCGAKFSIKYVDHGPYFAGEKNSRDIYRFTIKTPLGKYSAKFGQSIFGSERNEVPTSYDVLASIASDYYAGDSNFSCFISEYGYDTDCFGGLRSAEKIWKACAKCYESLNRIFTKEQIDKLLEIQ